MGVNSGVPGLRLKLSRDIFSDMEKTDSDRTVGRIEGIHVPRAIDTLTMAFASDPTMRWLWPESSVYLRSFPRLVASFGGRAFEQGIPGYLESSNPANIPFYQRHGYEIIGEIQVGSSPVLTPMWRARG